MLERLHLRDLCKIGIKDDSDSPRQDNKSADSSQTSGNEEINGGS